MACPQSASPNCVVSVSHDRSLVVWRGAGARLGKKSADGIAAFSRFGDYGGAVSDIALSCGGEYAITSSWDRKVRIWNISKETLEGETPPHPDAVTSVALSPDNRRIVSACADHKLRLWNVRGELRYTFADLYGHSDLVSCVRFSPTAKVPLLVSGGYDGLVKIWSADLFSLVATLSGHADRVVSVAVAIDGSLCASASDDGHVRLWDLRSNALAAELTYDEQVRHVCFCPTRYWLCIATARAIRVIDLEAHTTVAELAAGDDGCTSLAWTADGSTLYSGHPSGEMWAWSVTD